MDRAQAIAAILASGGASPALREQNEAALRVLGVTRAEMAAAEEDQAIARLDQVIATLTTERAERIRNRLVVPGVTIPPQATGGR